MLSFADGLAVCRTLLVAGATAGDFKVRQAASNMTALFQALIP